MNMDAGTSKIFDYHVVVTPGDIDALGHVNNIVYLRWVQEAASGHWDQLSNEAINRKYVWVVMRHEINYYHPALLHQELDIKTWVGKNEGAKSERHTEIYNAATGKKLAAAITTWCLLDALSKRPARIEEDVLALMRV
jgi:acyl-CoA thioester hydrolase